MINNPAFVSGTRLLFQQATAPIGWTKDATASLDDSALRIVSTSAAGSGGSASFAAGCTVVASHTHTFSAISGTESADHVHSGATGGRNAAHNHNIGSSVSGNFPTTQTALGGTNQPVTLNWTSMGTESADHAHYFTTGGRSAVHTHMVSGTTATNSGAVWVPKYIDAIICVKN